MKLRWVPILLAVFLLSGCTALLERTYTTVEPHSSKFWESEAAGTLRAENHQDIVNDLLLLISQHTETATLRLYNFTDDVAVADTLEKATAEIMQETPLGAYAVEYITSSAQAQKGYYEAAIQIGYRRSAEQVQSLVNATSPEAVYALLETALNEEKTELAVRIGYWGVNGRELVESAMAQLQEEKQPDGEKPWLVYYYPAEGPVGLLEFLLDPTEEQLAAERPLHAQVGPHVTEEAEPAGEETGEEAGVPSPEEALPEGEAAEEAPAPEETEKTEENPEKN